MGLQVGVSGLVGVDVNVEFPEVNHLFFIHALEAMDILQVDIAH